MLCRILQVLLMVQGVCLVSQEPVEVVELTSSIRASKRNFPCKNEDIVYRCVTRSLPMNQFQTTWTWNNRDQVVTFHPNTTVGGNNSCNSDDKLTFLHSTLVFANTTTCVSLLTVTPSLPNYEDVSVPIECEVTTTGVMQIHRRGTIMHNTVSGAPEWGNITDSEDNITLTCSTFNETRFLVNVSWPPIINYQDMDFDYYTLNLTITGENDEAIYFFTDKTTITYYENIMFHVESPEAANNLRAQVTISAINKCENANTLPSVSWFLNKDVNCSNYVYILTSPNPKPSSGNDQDSLSKPTYIMYAIITCLVAGLLTFHYICI